MPTIQMHLVQKSLHVVDRKTFAFAFTFTSSDLIAAYVV